MNTGKPLLFNDKQSSTSDVQEHAKKYFGLAARQVLHSSRRSQLMHLGCRRTWKQMWLLCKLCAPVIVEGFELRGPEKSCFQHVSFASILYMLETRTLLVTKGITTRSNPKAEAVERSSSSCIHPLTRISDAIIAKTKHS